MQSKHPVEPLDIRIGSTVQCRDGRAGHVTKVVVEPGSKRVTDIVVERGLLLHRDIVVPISLIKDVRDDTVELDVSIDELKSLPEFNEVDFAMPDDTWTEGHDYPPGVVRIDLRNPALRIGELAPAWSAVMMVGHTHVGVSGAETPIGRGTRVSCRDGAVGRIDHVLVDPESGRVRAIVVRKGGLLTKDVIVPTSWVEAVQEDEIILAANRELLERLPEYRPARSDTQISTDVQQALAADERTRGQAIDVRVELGVVYLRGVVTTEEAKQAATEAAERVQGVWEIDHSDLLAESAVAKAVRDALARDPRTTQDAIDVTCVGGTITLLGQVRTPEEKTAAVEIARSVKGVVAVIDQLEVRPEAERKGWPAAAERLLATSGSAALLRRS